MGDSLDDIKTLPLDALHRALGARMVPFAGYTMPIQYEGIVAEHNWTRGHAGLFDVSHMGQLVLEGDAVDAALEALMPGDFAGLKPNRMRYSMLLNDGGGILDDLMVTRRDGDFYVVVNGATKQADIDWMHGKLPGTVKLIQEESWALLALQGPEAVAVLERLAPGVAELGFMTAGDFTIAGCPAWVSRSGYTGEDGFEISIPASEAEHVAKALLAEAEVKPIGLGARDSLRLEAGLPLYGHDLTSEITPIEAALTFAVSKSRREIGGFPGSDRILGQLRDGPARKRVGLRLDGRQPVREGAAVIVDGKTVGEVTSGGHGPALGAPIAMAYVPAALAAVGTRLQIEARGRLLDATVVPMPFFPKNYVRKGAAK